MHCANRLHLDCEWRHFLLPSALTVNKSTVSFPVLNYNFFVLNRLIYLPHQNTLHKKNRAYIANDKILKRVQQTQNWSREARRGEAVPRRIAGHVVQYVYSGSIHTRRGEAARNTIVFLHARAILASESQSLHSTF